MRPRLHRKKKIPSPGSGGAHRLLWALLSFLIGGASIWAVLHQARDVSLASVWLRLRALSPLWLTGAVGGMLGFVLFEARAIRTVCNALGAPSSPLRSGAYAASDIYFSAITPSASGGQPACAYLMIQDGVPVSTTAAVLLINLAMYTMSILLIGLLSFLLRPRIFLRFGLLSRTLILAGFAVQLLMALFFFLLVWNERLLTRLSLGCLRLLARLRLVRREKALRRKLGTIMEEYRQSAGLLTGQRSLLLKVLLFNFLQRASLISVTMCVYLAGGGGALSGFDMWSMQSYVVLGSNYVPIPGGMAVTDYLMLDGFGSLMSAQEAVDLEMISRSLSFYLCILLCGAALLLRLLVTLKRKRR